VARPLLGLVARRNGDHLQPAIGTFGELGGADMQRLEHAAADVAETCEGDAQRWSHRKESLMASKTLQRSLRQGLKISFAGRSPRAGCRLRLSAWIRNRPVGCRRRLRPAHGWPARLP